MRTFLTCLSALLCCVLLMGAGEYGAPVMPGKNFYVNDYAGVIDPETRGKMLKTAQELNEKSGVQVIVLTVANTGGETIEAYADSVFRGWEIGGADGKNGMLILVVTEGHYICPIIGENIRRFAGHIPTEATDALESGDFSKAASVYFYDSTAKILENIEAVKQYQYTQSSQKSENTHTVNETDSTQLTKDTENVNADKSGSSKRGDVFYAISIVLFLFVALRSIKVAAKYRKRYNKHYQRKHIPVTNPYSRTGARHDDGDYPSGFGGLGNRKAIYGEDVNESNDIGIIKRDSGDTPQDEANGEE